MNPRCWGALAAIAVLSWAPDAAAVGSAAEVRALEELRNTVVNLLQALVEQGVMTREQAEKLVADAQARTTAEMAERDTVEEGAVRVTHVPEFIKEEIRKAVADEVRPAVVGDVVARAKAERWGVPAALPGWLDRVAWSGDLRLRLQADEFEDGNLPNFYRDFNEINAAGGEARAGPAAFVNVLESRHYALVQARLGLDVDLGGGFRGGARLVTGNAANPVSANQVLGNYGGKFGVGFDRAYIGWNLANSQAFEWLGIEAGRFANPWISTELIFDRDFAFDGLAGTVRFPFNPAGFSNIFLTVGAHPIEEVELSNLDKTLLAGQLGVDLVFSEGHRLRLAGAFYDFRNVQGRRNAPDSTLLDFTAPRFLGRGNTVFDIRNDLDETTNLFALAGKYRLVNAVAQYDFPVFGRYRATLTADWVDNIGWKRDEVLAMSGIDAEERTVGWHLEFALGSRTAEMRRSAWRAFFVYRYVERDAVLDAFTESELRGGGTDLEGYSVGFDYGLGDRVFLRTRYLTGDEIDGAPFGQDRLQIELNAQY